jgi:hypothetical protein
MERLTTGLTTAGAGGKQQGRDRGAHRRVTGAVGRAVNGHLPRAQRDVEDRPARRARTACQTDDAPPRPRRVAALRARPGGCGEGAVGGADHARCLSVGGCASTPIGIATRTCVRVRSFQARRTAASVAPAASRRRFCRRRRRVRQRWRDGSSRAPFALCEFFAHTREEASCVPAAAGALARTVDPGEQEQRSAFELAGGVVAERPAQPHGASHGIQTCRLSRWRLRNSLRRLSSRSSARWASTVWSTRRRGAVRFDGGEVGGSTDVRAGVSEGVPVVPGAQLGSTNDVG